MLRALLAAALMICAGAARAQSAAVPLPGESAAVVVGPHAEVLEDKEGKLGLQDVMAPGRAYTQLLQEIPNFGYTYSAYWLRFRLPADATRLPVPFLAFEIRYPGIDAIELYLPYRTAGGAVAYTLKRAGDLLPFEAREVKHRSHVFRIAAGGLAEAPVYLRVQTQGVLSLPMYLWRAEAFLSADRTAQLLYGMFYGLLLAMFLYNAMLFFALRDQSYLWYVLNVAVFGLGLAALDGFAFQYLWPESVWWANHALAVAFWATLLCGTQFARNFLDMRRMAPNIDRLLLAVVVVSAAGVLVSATGALVSYGTAMRALSVASFITVTLVLAATVRALLRGYRPARFFLLAQAALLVFIALAMLRNFALVPSHFLTVNGLHIGLALDVMLLSFALADRINLIKRESAEVRTQAREREQMMEQMRHMAQHDPLTGLPNRLSMQQRLALAMELAKRNRKKLAVMMVDLDGFKRLNDTRGHISGDHALAQIAGRLRTSVRGSDTVARYGGDEFVVLAGELDRAEDASNIAEKIADMVSLPLSIDGVTAKICCSIGISIFPDHAEDAEGLIERADRAMYAAKPAKNLRYAFFSPS